MKKKLFFSVCLSLPLALFPLSAPAEEGSPLLSVDDLIALEDSYEAFLNELGDLAVQRLACFPKRIAARGTTRSLADPIFRTADTARF